jgi:AraC family ethanolamine operon transcriptional activator
VQDVAEAWGFWHLSQFATDYRRLFGKRPSETLRERASRVEAG